MITMAFDFKKEFKKFYRPSEKPEIIEIPKMNFIAVREKMASIRKQLKCYMELPTLLK